MSRVLDYLLNIRQELADPKGERWSNSRLLSLLSDSQTEIAHELRCLISKITIAVVEGTREYKLPDDTDILLRAYGENGPIEVLSHYEMDSVNCTWEHDTGPTVSKVIFDLLTPNRIILYPIPSKNSAGAQYTFTDGDESFVGGERLGVVTAIDNYSFSSPFGVVTKLFEPGILESISSVYGVTTDISEIYSTLAIQYARRPAVLTSTNSIIELTESAKLAMVHLTCARALSADLDTKSAALASTHFSLYNAQMARLKNNASHNSAKGSTSRMVKREVF